MSSSRSPSPISNTASSNILPTTETTTSRTDSHDHILSAPPLEQHSSRHSQSSNPLASTSDTPYPRDPHMAQTLARDTNQPEDARSSCSADSHDADNERDQLAEQQEAPPPAPPQKKKRTRTLTTPHQSAVLHALLAQSRFPSTAVREEVGRSIGLSARKVQIWFQNQRQKARRPHGMADPSRKRAPQYGPFPPNVSDTSVAGSSMADHRAGSETAYRYQYGGMTSDQGAYSGYHSDSPAQLSGPGIPGTEYQYQPQGIDRPSTAPTRPRDEPRSSLQYERLGSTYPTATHDYDRRPATSHSHYAGYDRESRTLPPLIVPSRRQSSSPISNRGLPLLSFTSPRTSSLEPTRSLHSHEPSERHRGRFSPPHSIPPLRRDTVPPPLRFRSPSPYASSSTYLRPETPPASASPTQQAFGRPARTASTSTDASSPRPPGRYDPVRGTFIPTPTPSEGHKSRSPSPSA